MREQFEAWWGERSERERQLSLLSAAFLLLALVYWGAWQPLATQLQESERQLRSAQQTLNWVEDKARVLVQAGVGRQKAGAGQLTLIQLVNSSAKQYGVNFSRVVNKKEEIEVWIDAVEFDQFIRWLTALNNQHSVSVLATDISRIEQQGHIKVNRLLLAK